MKHKSPPWIAIIFLVTVVATVIWAFSQILGRPRWELSATNTPAGLEIEVFQEEDSTPTYTTLLPNHQVKRNITRKTIDMLPGDVGETTLRDETMKPGQWTLIIDGVELDITPRAMTIDRAMEISPAPKIR